MDWIKVSERLPETCLKVLCCDMGADEMRLMFFVAWRSSEGLWYSENRRDRRAWPTHWMPLPEPPES